MLSLLLAISFSHLVNVSYEPSAQALFLRFVVRHQSVGRGDHEHSEAHPWQVLALPLVPFAPLHCKAGLDCRALVDPAQELYLEVSVLPVVHELEVPDEALALQYLESLAHQLGRLYLARRLAEHLVCLDGVERISQWVVCHNHPSGSSVFPETYLLRDLAEAPPAYLHPV